MRPRIKSVFFVMVSQHTGHIWNSLEPLSGHYRAWTAGKQYMLSGATDAMTCCEHLPALRPWPVLGLALSCQRVATQGYSVEGNKAAENDFCFIKC